MRSHASTRLRKSRIFASRDLLSKPDRLQRALAGSDDASGAGENRLPSHKNRSPWPGEEVLVRRAGRRRRDIGWRRLAREQGISATLVACALDKVRRWHKPLQTEL